MGIKDRRAGERTQELMSGDREVLRLNPNEWPDESMVDQAWKVASINNEGGWVAGSTLFYR